MKILTHICCGPCGVVFSDGLRRDGFDSVMLWHNPNIHPFTEYKSRKKSAIDFAAQDGYDIIIPDDEKYGLRYFLDSTYHNLEKRCEICYCMRLEYAAKYAADAGFAAYSTTLLASPYQDFDAICRIGKQAAKNYGINFVVQDYRAQYRPGLKTARKMGLYMQKYCGCLFSEEERYI